MVVRFHTLLSQSGWKWNHIIDKVFSFAFLFQNVLWAKGWFDTLNIKPEQKTNNRNVFFKNPFSKTKVRRINKATPSVLKCHRACQTWAPSFCSLARHFKSWCQTPLSHLVAQCSRFKRQINSTGAEKNTTTGKTVGNSDSWRMTGFMDDA